MKTEDIAPVVQRLKMLEALAKYGQHLPGCLVLLAASNGSPIPAPCDCGWAEARRELLRPAQLEAEPERRRRKREEESE